MKKKLETAKEVKPVASNSDLERHDRGIVPCPPSSFSLSFFLSSSFDVIKIFLSFESALFPLERMSTTETTIKAIKEEKIVGKEKKNKILVGDSVSR